MGGGECRRKEEGRGHRWMAANPGKIDILRILDLVGEGPQPPAFCCALASLGSGIVQMRKLRLRGQCLDPLPMCLGEQEQG